MTKYLLIPAIVTGIFTIISVAALVYPGIFGIKEDSINIITILPPIATVIIGVSYFSIQQHMTKSEKMQKKRDDHFKNLQKDVFEYWTKKPASLLAEGQPHFSLTDLYVNTSVIIRNPIRYQRVKSHLEHEDYKEIKSLMEQIENRSDNHNNKVSDFLNSVENNLTEKVFTKDSVVISDFTEYKDPKQDNGYSLANILNYYKQEATYSHKELRVRKESGTARFQILIEDTYINPLAIATDEKQLQSIKEKLEGELKNDIVDCFEGLLKEGREVTNLYNDKFVPEIKNLIVEIEDEGQLKGGCGLSYCTK